MVVQRGSMGTRCNISQGSRVLWDIVILLGHNAKNRTLFSIILNVLVNIYNRRLTLANTSLPSALNNLSALS